jgi:hypothetical protein
MEPIAALYAVVDTEFWSLEELRGWATMQEQSTSTPEVWLLELTRVGSREEAERILLDALRAVGVTLCDIGTIELGLVYSKWQQGRATWPTSYSELVDIADANGEGVLLNLLADDESRLRPTDAVRQHLGALSGRALKEIATALGVAVHRPFRGTNEQ